MKKAENQTKEFYEDFSKSFEKFLNRKNLKIADIAKKLNLTNAAVSAWKNAVSIPDYQKQKKLIQLGMTYKELFGEQIDIIAKINEKEIELNELKQNLSTWQLSAFSAGALQLGENETKRIEANLKEAVKNKENEIEKLKNNKN